MVKLRSLLALFCLALLSACSSQPSDGPQVPQVPGEEGEESHMAAPNASSAAMEQVGPSDMVLGEDGVYNLAVSAMDWYYKPSAIYVEQGQQVRLVIESLGSTHGFVAPGLGISARIQDGQTVELMLPTDRVGTFEFFNNIPAAGMQHTLMRGTITIQ